MFGYNQQSILIHSKDAKCKSRYQQTSEIKGSCCTESQAYVTQLIYDEF